MSIDSTCYREGNSIGLPQSQPVEGFWARITGQGENEDNKMVYEWVKIQIKAKGEHIDHNATTAGGMYKSVTTAGVIHWGAVEANGNENIEVDSVVWLTTSFIDSDNNEIEFRFTGVINMGMLYPCNVNKETGSAGSTTTACTYAYSATSMDNSTLLLAADAQQPHWLRPPKGAMTIASHGTYYRDGEGNVVLWQVDEQPDAGGC